ncbi:hypothetical protein chiPu_0031481, partial [Chiloscyllium punctatum]|nr:hypothetical protein [Chiloscyllium punctatum]
RKAHRIEIVEHLGSVMLDLREQNGLERRRALHALLTRPPALQHFVVSIGEEGFGRAIEHRLEKMRRTKTIVQEHVATCRESRGICRKLVQSRQIGRIETAILEQTHWLCGPRQQPFHVQVWPDPANGFPIPALRCRQVANRLSERRLVDELGKCRDLPLDQLRGPTGQRSIQPFRHRRVEADLAARGADAFGHQVRHRLPRHHLGHAVGRFAGFRQ